MSTSPHQDMQSASEGHEEGPAGNQVPPQALSSPTTAGPLAEEGGAMSPSSRALVASLADGGSHFCVPPPQSLVSLSLGPPLYPLQSQGSAEDPLPPPRLYFPQRGLSSENPHPPLQPTTTRTRWRGMMKVPYPN